MTTVAAEPAAPAADDELGAQWKQRQPDIPISRRPPGPISGAGSS
jgi:hypothetical protein